MRSHRICARSTSCSPISLSGYCKVRASNEWNNLEYGKPLDRIRSRASCLVRWESIGLVNPIRCLAFSILSSFTHEGCTCTNGAHVQKSAPGIWGCYSDIKIVHLAMCIIGLSNSFRVSRLSSVVSMSERRGDGERAGVLFLNPRGLSLCS
jgi:hypothetical protein